MLEINLPTKVVQDSTKIVVDAMKVDTGAILTKLSAESIR